MTIKEFKALVSEAANGEYHAIKVEISTNSFGETEIEFGAYINGLGWGSGSTEHEALGQCLGTVRNYGGDLSELGSAE